MRSEEATKVSYKGFDVVDGMEITWNKLYGNDLSNAAEQVEKRLDSLLKPLRHKNIIKSYRTWVDHESGSINVITRSFTSGNLREFRRKHRSVDVIVIKNWARQILQALIYTTSECLKIEEGNKGKLQAANRILLGKVKDIQVRQFIEKCLVPTSTMAFPSVEELLKHPFLEKTSTSLPMGMVREADRHPVSVTEFKALNKRNEFRLTGERRDENSASFVLRIADLFHRGRVANIEFTFCVDTDTTISVAGEMVQELGLQMEDVSLIVEL
ncbi:hypothetical protein RHSIM_Rhsim04G0117200 [Rhododendron simsii]|uniref:non-specific serine/threonine protein kinase n=1 Tax=Rhododendron simsii TaxID=118357 RepID=A0A834H308_RHOSS|nr:hypothetical protein RHSIM_Rhsim04G0117200 [Rhododendron simsii]